MIVEHRKLDKFRHWKCGGCNKLLGVIYPTRTLAIKYKDFVGYVDGEIKIICTFCKSENIYDSKMVLENLNGE